MWVKPTQPVAIHPSQLRIGLYVWLNIPWDDHPFLYNKFRIASVEQLDQILALKLPEILYFPNKSTVEPGAKVLNGSPSSSAKPKTATTAAATAIDEKREKLRRQKESAARAERGWERAAATAREAIIGLANAPKQAGELLAELSRETTTLISSGEEVLLHLLGDKRGEGMHFHALNVMTLSMLLGKVTGLSPLELSDLAMGAVSHDAGKARIPFHILESRARAKHEEDFYRQHPAYGVEMAHESGAFNAAAIAVIADHHEFLDGSGWPQGKKNLSPLAQIVSLVNRYDRLCGPESPQVRGLMPSEALASIYTKEAERFDRKLVSHLIRLLGVYPPGTVVQLSDASLGLVVSPGSDSLRPKVLIYSPEVSKDDAPVIDLLVEPELKIAEAVRPSLLPADVLEWMNPRQRLSYFFSTEKKPS
ncbi:MAG: HD domain-containing phosphohydrolase [Burkholderiaceae bacterium]|jgi:HD-GYP domain-containing protein (c-di-GMP phosphodiesterase class II)